MTRIGIFLKYGDIMELLGWFHEHNLEIRISTKNKTGVGEEYLTIDISSVMDHYRFHVLESDKKSIYQPNGGGDLWFDFDDPHMATLFKMRWH